MARENGWLKYDCFLLGGPILGGYVSFRECGYPLYILSGLGVGVVCGDMMCLFYHG